MAHVPHCATHQAVLASAFASSSHAIETAFDQATDGSRGQPPPLLGITRLRFDHRGQRAGALEVFLKCCWFLLVHSPVRCL